MTGAIDSKAGDQRILSTQPFPENFATVEIARGTREICEKPEDSYEQALLNSEWLQRMPFFAGSRTITLSDDY
jgi:hypothetical protein